MRFRRSILIGWVGVLLASTAFGQTVAQDELRSADLASIHFESYVGPHRIIETRKAIQAIGTQLGQALLKQPDAPADFAGKYRVIRIHDASSDLLSADILELTPQATVDDIRNLNWIVSSYLQTVFGYTADEGDLVADFVTRYNALYRGRFSELAGRYLAAVTKALDPTKAGLALKYSEWPGKTQMVIPLRDSLSKGLSGSVNTEEISNKDVTTAMKSEPDQGVAERKKLADLKETEIVQEQKAIVKAEAQATAPAAPATPPPAAPAAKTAPAPTPPPAKGTTPATPAPAAATPAKPVIPLEKAKAQVEARDKALQQERQDIVKTETKQEATPPPPPVVPATPTALQAFVHWDESTQRGQLWLLDTDKHTVWKRSELNTIRRPDLVPVGKNWLVVAGDAKTATGAVRLVLLSGTDATVMATGADDVSPGSTPVMVGSNFATLVPLGHGQWTVALFDAQLAKKTQSDQAVAEHTPLVAGQRLFVQAAGGAVLALDPQSLAVVAKTEK